MVTGRRKPFTENPGADFDIFAIATADALVFVSVNERVFAWPSRTFPKLSVPGWQVRTGPAAATEAGMPRLRSRKTTEKRAQEYRLPDAHIAIAVSGFECCGRKSEWCNQQSCRFANLRVTEGQPNSPKCRRLQFSLPATFSTAFKISPSFATFARSLMFWKRGRCSSSFFT
jgi:hypothetical protein